MTKGKTATFHGANGHTETVTVLRYRKDWASARLESMGYVLVQFTDGSRISAHRDALTFK